MLGVVGPNSGCSCGAAPAETSPCPAAGGLGEGRWTWEPPGLDMKVVHAEVMMEQGNGSVAFSRREMCLENMLVTGGVGLKRGKWRCGQSILSFGKGMGLHEWLPLGVASMSVQTPSQFALDLLSFQSHHHFSPKNPYAACHSTQVSHLPIKPPSFKPAPSSQLPGDSQCANEPIHPLEAPVSCLCSASQAHHKQRFTSSGSGDSLGMSPLIPCWRAESRDAADPVAGGVHVGSRCLYISAAWCWQLGNASEGNWAEFLQFLSSAGCWWCWWDSAGCCPMRAWQWVSEEKQLFCVLRRKTKWGNKNVKANMVRNHYWVVSA